MFPFPSPLDFLRAFALAFLAGATAGTAAVVLALAAFSTFKRSFRFGCKL